MTESSLLTKEEKSLDTKEIDIFGLLVDADEQEKIKLWLQNLSMLDRALDGKPIEPTDIISGLINLKDIRERSRFPTILDVKAQTYKRLLAEKIPECKAFEEWANQEAHALISLKGESRKEGVEMAKAQGMIMSGVAPVFLGEMPSGQPKGRFQRLKERVSGKPEE